MSNPKLPPQADSVLKVLKNLTKPQRKFGDMLIVLEKHCGFLAKDMTEAFEGQKGVQVIVDRRGNGFLEKSKKTSEERRKSQEELLEVVIFT